MTLPDPPDPPDPADRLRRLGRGADVEPAREFGPGVRRAAPSSSTSGSATWPAVPPAVPSAVAPGTSPRARPWSRPEPDEPAARIGWPTAPPGTPAARLRLPHVPSLEHRPAQQPEPSADPEPERDAGWDEGWDEDWDEDWDDGEEPEPAQPPSAGGRLAERWLPASWRGARWDPGRLGAVALAAVAAVAAVIAAIGVWSGRPVPEAVPTLPAVSDARPAPAPGPAPGSPLVVSVSGKVRKPGLVRLVGGARVGDAVDAAGGATPGADLTGLNLAARVADGEQVVVGVPAPAAPAAAPAAAAAGGGAAAPAPGGKVDLNQATLEQLDGLPGVGPVTAKKILDWRTQNGRFAAVEQLQEVSGIGEARFATLRELVTV